MKYLIGMILVGIIILGIAGYWYRANRESAVTSPVVTTMPLPNSQSTLAPELEKALSLQVALMESLAVEGVIVAETSKSNVKNKGMTQEQITVLDQEWQTAQAVTPFVDSFLKNVTAERLLQFQREQKQFKEIFVTDTYGLNVGQTDKTSDYYQADEEWWKNSFDNGNGKSLYGKIEFDASSQTQAISVYVPIRDAVSGRAIGVMKGVLDLSSISDSL